MGGDIYQLEGEERIEWSGVFPDHRRERLSREPRKGLYIAREELKGLQVFEVHPFGGIFRTDRVKQFVEDQGYTNVDFYEMGEVF